jgi:hypothetical protein
MAVLCKIFTVSSLDGNGSLQYVVLEIFYSYIVYVINRINADV